MVTVEELLEQHRRCVKAHREIDDINLLYPESSLAGTGIEGFENFMWEEAYKRKLVEVKKMREMLVEAAPEVYTEARRIALAEKDNV